MSWTIRDEFSQNGYHPDFVRDTPPRMLDLDLDVFFEVDGCSLGVSGDERLAAYILSVTCADECLSQLGEARDFIADFATRRCLPNWGKQSLEEKRWIADLQKGIDALREIRDSIKIVSTLPESDARVVARRASREAAIRHLESTRQSLLKTGGLKHVNPSAATQVIVEGFLLALWPTANTRRVASHVASIICESPWRDAMDLPIRTAAATQKQRKSDLIGTLRESGLEWSPPAYASDDAPPYIQNFFGQIGGNGFLLSGLRRLVEVR